MRIPRNVRWIGFDLDDTLHHFRKASDKASEAVFLYIHDEFGIPVSDLRNSYQNILQESQSRYFVDGRAAREYRADRFGNLLGKFSILPHIHLDYILDLYNDTLTGNLSLTDGAKESLIAAKENGFSVFILTEGPLDAQTAVVERLGLKPYVDFLMTSSQEGCSKSDGLFTKALKKAGCLPEQVVYVGDSMDRDILPSQSLGIRTILLSERPVEKTVTISSLDALSAAIKDAQRPERMFSTFRPIIELIYN